MKWRRLALLVSGCLAWLHVSISHAFVATPDNLGQLPRWNLGPNISADTNVVNPVTQAVRFYLSADAYSTAHREAELNSIRACFAQWQSIPGTALKFEEAGVLPGVKDIDTVDNTNMVMWAKSSLWVNGGLDNISGTLAVAMYDFMEDGTLAECDIVFNGVENQWSAVPTDASGVVYIEPVLIHEIGHMIGLDHSPVGGAIMLSRGESGQGVGTGLTSDEIAAARALYPRADWAGRLGTIQGQVVLSGAGVLGAVVTVEDAAGNMIGGTVTLANGRYTMPALPPGNYAVRVTPLDPANSNYSLLTGYDIMPDYYGGAKTSFLPSAPISTAVVGGQTATVNFTVTSGNPAFRISLLREPNTDPLNGVSINAPVSVSPGQKNLIVGVLSHDAPNSDVTLSVSGDGLLLGPTQHTLTDGAVYHLLSATIDVAIDATPGMRTLILRRGQDVAYANGFLVVLPLVPDVNFDGLDDRFQRQYFPLFTAPEAAPGADPDHDGFTNLVEYVAGSNPVDATSYLRFKGIQLTPLGGIQLEWFGAAGKKYQILARDPALGGAWLFLAPLVSGAGATTQWIDTQTGQSQKLYRLQAIP